MNDTITHEDMRKARMRLAVNQQTFAKLVGYSQVGYSRIENNKAPMVRALYELALAWDEAPEAFERRKKEIEGE